MAFEIQVPEDVKFRTRQETNHSPGFEWKDITYNDVFQDKRVVVFALPGAWTPTCSSTHLPGYDALYPELKAAGIDEVYCLSVNDSFTMNAWFNHLGVKNVKPLPDGNGEFTRKMGMLVKKDNLGFGDRSWRYSMIVNNGEVEMLWVEPGLGDNAQDDPFEVSDVNTMLEWLNE